MFARVPYELFVSPLLFGNKCFKIIILLKNYQPYPTALVIILFPLVLPVKKVNLAS
jgi:hypothetical protein